MRADVIQIILIVFHHFLGNTLIQRGNDLRAREKYLLITLDIVIILRITQPHIGNASELICNLVKSGEVEGR